VLPQTLEKKRMVSCSEYSFSLVGEMQ